MTGRELLFKALKGAVLDKPPFWLLFPYHATDYYVDVRDHHDYRAIHELALRRGITLNRRNLECDYFAADVKTNDDGLSYDNVTLDRKNGHLLVSDDDLDAILSVPVLTDQCQIYAQLESQLDKYLRERDEFPKDAGAMMLDLGEPINFIYFNSNLESLALWSITQPDRIIALLDRLMERYRHIYRFCLERDLAEVYFMVGSELASPPVFSVETFNSWIVPYAIELNEMVHSYGRYVIQHYHGQIREILPAFLEMGPDALHTIESPPIGNCTIDQAYQVVGDRITLIGNIQYDEFRALTPEEMQEAVRALRREVGSRRFILSPSAGPFDEDPTENLINNYHAFIAAAVG